MLWYPREGGVCGRIPNANRYDNETIADDILMVLQR